LQGESCRLKQASKQWVFHEICHGLCEPWFKAQKQLRYAG